MQKLLGVHACAEHPSDALEECLSARANNRCIIAIILVMQIFKEAAQNHCHQLPHSSFLSPLLLIHVDTFHDISASLCYKKLSKLDCRLVMFCFGQAIAVFLKSTTNLVDLDLSWNDFGDKEAEAWDSGED